MTGGAARRRARIGGALAAAAATLVLTGCGGVPSESADAEAGRDLFINGCGSCHVLEEAGTAGRVGPNLDDAFRGARRQGFGESVIHAVTREWIALAELPMPRDIYEGDDAEDVAAYVAEVAGLDPTSEVRPPQPEAQGSPPDPEIPADAPRPEQVEGAPNEAGAAGEDEAPDELPAEVEEESSGGDE